MRISEKLHEQVRDIVLEATNEFVRLLKERNIKSINFYEYWSERGLDRSLLFDCDDDGYGVALYVDSLEFDGKDVTFHMKDTNDNDYDDWTLEYATFDGTNAISLLWMLEDVLEEADEEDNGRVLEKDETFDDWE